MKVITTIQFILFILIIGFAGGWEIGDVSGYWFVVEVLSVTVIILCLQLLKGRINKINARRFYNNYQLSTFNYQLKKGRSN